MQIIKRKMNGFQGMYLKTASVLNLKKYFLFVRDGLEKKFPKGERTHLEYKKLISMNRGLLPVFQINALEYIDTFGKKCISFNNQIEIIILISNKKELERIRKLINKQHFVLMSYLNNDGNLRVLINVKNINLKNSDYDTLLMKYDNIYNTWVYIIRNYLRRKYGLLIDNCPDRSMAAKVEYSYDEEAYYNEFAGVFDFKYMKGVKGLNRILYEFIFDSANNPCYKGYRHIRISNRIMSLYLIEKISMNDIRLFLKHCCNDIGEVDLERMINNAIRTKKKNDVRDLLISLPLKDFFMQTMEGEQLQNALEDIEVCRIMMNEAKQNRDKSA